MTRARVLLLSSAVVCLGVAAACGDDDDSVAVRPSGDAGRDAYVAPPGADGGSSCNLGTLPTEYTSAAFETNAKAELDLRTAFAAFLKPFTDNETLAGDGGTGTTVTKASLDALWAGTPSVKAITTTYYQARINGWLTAYETASGAGSMNTQMALVGAVPDAGPPSSGGFYGRNAFDSNLVDLKQAIEKGSYTAAFFNHAAGIVAAGNLTEASIDRLIAAWGAHSSFQNNHLATAGATNATRDIQSAGYAARRTPKDGKIGPYLRAKAALIKAKAAITAGASCNAERDAAVKEFFLEWEKATYATVVFYFSEIVGKLSPAAPGASDATAWSGIFHSHGECIGFLAGFKTTSQAYRKITDTQIDGLLTKALVPETPPTRIVELKTTPGTAVISLNATLADIKTIYGFTDEEMTSFKQVYTKP
jgi:hypothetical protein